MPVNAGRLGFWFRPRDRAQVSKTKPPKVLVFYDPLTDKSDPYGYYYPYWQYNYYDSGDVNPSTNVWPKIQAREQALGFVPELIVGYNNLPDDMSQYIHAWDIGYASPYTTNPNNPTTKLTNYLKQGGALFMLGENAYFGNRDNAIGNFITGLGGGTVSEHQVDANYYGWDSYYINVPSTIKQKYLLANTVNSVSFNAPNVFTSIGTGDAIATSNATALPVAVSWGTGTLSNAPAGAVVAVLDINFFGGYSTTVYDSNFVDNLSIIMNKT